MKGIESRAHTGVVMIRMEALYCGLPLLGKSAPGGTLCGAESGAESTTADRRRRSPGPGYLPYWDEFHNMLGIRRRNATIIQEFSTVIVLFDTMGRSA